MHNKKSLGSSRFCFMPVMFRVRLCCFGGVVCCMVQMPLSRMRVVSRRLVVARLVMFCRFAVVLAGVLKVFSCFVVMLCRLF
jgi:hypothetical protein